MTVRAYVLREGSFDYDGKKYAAMLHEAFEPFELFFLTPSSLGDSSEINNGMNSRQ